MCSSTTKRARGSGDRTTRSSPRSSLRPVYFATSGWAASQLITRRAYGDKGIYVSLECGCDWEHEHGLQIVFKNGLAGEQSRPV